MEELILLCERLITGDILLTDFRIKVSRIVKEMTEDQARELARALLLKD